MDKNDSWENAAWHRAVAKIWRELATEYGKSRNPINRELHTEALKDARWHDRYADKIERYQAMGVEETKDAG